MDDLTTLTNQQLAARLEQAQVDADALPFAYDNLGQLHEAEQRNTDLQRALRAEMARRVTEVVS